jgi:hypothetical protein
VGDEVEVHALVDDAEEADAGEGDARLVRRVGAAGAGLAEMGRVHAAGKGEDLRVAAPLGLVQAVAAGEHEVGTLEQAVLVLAKPGRRVMEVRQLVHAVVNANVRRYVIAERERHGGVIPSHRLGGGRSARRPSSKA